MDPGDCDGSWGPQWNTCTAMCPGDHNLDHNGTYGPQLVQATVIGPRCVPGTVMGPGDPNGTAMGPVDQNWFRGLQWQCNGSWIPQRNCNGSWVLHSIAIELQWVPRTAMDPGDHNANGTAIDSGYHNGSWEPQWDGKGILGPLWDRNWSTMLPGYSNGSWGLHGSWGPQWVLGTTVGPGDHNGSWGPQ